MRLHKSSGLPAAARHTARGGLVGIQDSGAALALLGSTCRVRFPYCSYGMTLFMPASGIAMYYYGGKGLPFSYTIPGRPSPPKRTKVRRAFVSLAQTCWSGFRVLGPLHMAASGYHVMKGQAIFRRINPFA